MLNQLLHVILTWRATFALKAIEGSKYKIAKNTLSTCAEDISNRQRILHIFTSCVLS